MNNNAPWKGPMNARLLESQIFWLRARLLLCHLLWWGCVMTLLVTCADQVLSAGYSVKPIFHTGERLWLWALAVSCLWSVNWAGQLVSEKMDEACHVLTQMLGGGEPPDIQE